jgi:predicted nucleotidyltransferase
MLIDEKCEEIAKARQRYGIQRLFIFGSALRDDFRLAESEINLLVEFGPLDNTAKLHSNLQARAAFAKILQAEVDLVMSGAVTNKDIASVIDRTKKILYGV